MTAWKGIVGKPYDTDGFQEYVDSLDFSHWTPEFIVLHNTGIPTFAHWHDEAGEVRMGILADYYRKTKGWSGGPHVFVADDHIWPFTPLTVPGVHAPSWNAVSWGVEMVGNYEVEDMVPEVFDNTVSVLATLFSILDKSPDVLRLHHEDPLTDHHDCPGHNLIKADMITAVKEALA